MEAITLRHATNADISEMERVIADSAARLSIGYYTEKQIVAAIQYLFGVDSQLVEDQTYLIAEAGSQVVGCGGWSKRETLYGGDQHKTVTKGRLLDPAQQPARIRAFFVHPEWARKGVGTAILDACEQEAEGFGFRAFTLGATLPGVPFYERRGYHHVSEETIELPGLIRLPIVVMQKGILD